MQVGKSFTCKLDFNDTGTVSHYHCQLYYPLAITGHKQMKKFIDHLKIKCTQGKPSTGKTEHYLPVAAPVAFNSSKTFPVGPLLPLVLTVYEGLKKKSE